MEGGGSETAKDSMGFFKYVFNKVFKKRTFGFYIINFIQLRDFNDFSLVITNNHYIYNPIFVKYIFDLYLYIL